MGSACHVGKRLLHLIERKLLVDHQHEIRFDLPQVRRATIGGVGGIYIKTKQANGVVRLTAKHPWLGSKTLDIKVGPAKAGSMGSI